MDRAIETKRWGSRRIAIVSGIVAVMVLVMFTYFQTRGKSRLTVERDKLTIEPVQKGKFQEFIPITGIVQPIHTVHLDAVVGGTVEELFTEDGKMVKKGDPILRLSNSQLQMDYINREAQLMEQQDNIRSTLLSLEQKSVSQRQELLQLDYEILEGKRNYEVNKTLDNDKLVAKNDYSKSKEQYEYLLEKRKLMLQTIKSDSIFRSTQEEPMKASLQLIQKNLGFIQASLDNLVIRAPINGQVSSLDAEIGETQTQGKNIAQIDVLDDFKVRAKIGEHYISRIQAGLMAIFKMDGKDYQLTISKIYPEVSNGEFEVDMKFSADKPANIKRGQNLQIKLALGDETQAVLLPRGGFYQNTGGNWVYVIDKNMAHKRNIQLGRQNPDFYEVLDGLETGEQVITSKYEAFNDADELIIENK